MASENERPEPSGECSCLCFLEKYARLHPERVRKQLREAVRRVINPAKLKGGNDGR